MMSVCAAQSMNITSICAAQSMNITSICAAQSMNITSICAAQSMNIIIHQYCFPKTVPFDFKIYMEKMSLNYLFYILYYSVLVNML